MRMNADSDEEGRGDDYDPSQDDLRQPDDDRAFWRRRFIILCGGVVALGACAWLFPAAHQPSAQQAAATRAAVAALAKRQALPSAAYGSAWPEPKKPSPSPSAPPAASPTAPARLANTGTTPTAAAQPSSTASAGAACAPADIVLSLLTSQPSYTQGERPTFSVYAVSTSAAPCTLTYGAGSVQVVVTRSGHLVWDSAACDSSAAPPVQFTLGVPQMLTMVWNPKAAQPADCAGSLPARASGTLDAVAMSHGQSSPVRAFKISRLPVA